MCNFILPFLLSFKLCATLAWDPLLLQALGEKQQAAELLVQLLPSACRAQQSKSSCSRAWTGQGSELHPQVFTGCCARLQGSTAQICVHAAAPHHQFAMQAAQVLLLMLPSNAGAASPGFIDVAQSELYTTFIFCISSSKACVALSNSLTRRWMIHNLSVITGIL